jgi:hypothetical protein
VIILSNGKLGMSERFNKRLLRSVNSEVISEEPT